MGAVVDVSQQIPQFPCKYSALVLSFLQLMSRPEKNLSILSLQYHCYPDDVGGAWGLTYEVNKRLVARGQTVHLITCKPAESLPDYEEIDGVHFHRISFKASKGFISLWGAVRKQVRHILKSGEIDLVPETVTVISGTTNITGVTGNIYMTDGTGYITGSDIRVTGGINTLYAFEAPISAAPARIHPRAIPEITDSACGTASTPAAK